MKFSITLATIALFSTIAFTQAVPTKSEPLAAEVPEAAIVPLPIHTCGPPIVDSAGKVVKRFMCPGTAAEAVEIPERVADVVTTPTPTPTRHCTGPIHDRRRKKRGMECPL